MNASHSKTRQSGSFASYLSKEDAQDAIRRLEDSDQMLMTYYLPQLCPLPKFSGPFNAFASFMDIVALLLLFAQIHLSLFDWMRAKIVPKLGYFMPYFRKTSGRHTFKYQPQTITIFRLVDKKILTNSASEFYFKGRFFELTKGSFYT